MSLMSLVSTNLATDESNERILDQNLIQQFGLVRSWAKIAESLNRCITASLRKLKLCPENPP